jgi:hypothetical protein
LFRTSTIAIALTAVPRVTKKPKNVSTSGYALLGFERRSSMAMIPTGMVSPRSRYFTDQNAVGEAA